MGKTNILIPMAGAGERFCDEGYKKSKPAIPTYDRRTGRLVPMVLCATMDLPDVKAGGENIIYVDRSFHKSEGLEDEIRDFYPKASFITVDHLTEGQACTCLLAKEYIDNEEELLIAGCDNGMEYDCEFYRTAKKDADMLVFTYRNNESVLGNPNAYGWMILGEGNNIVDVSIKKAISNNPMDDHAVVATFWFKKGSIFVEAARKMLEEDDRINGEFYVDQVTKHVIRLGYKANVFEIERYIGWGTPKDYETYQKTFEYWRGLYNRVHF